MNRPKLIGLVSLIGLFFSLIASAQTTISAKGNIVVTKQVTGELAVLWTESGLVPNQWVTYEINGNASAIYACSTGSGATAMPTVGGPMSDDIAVMSSDSGSVRKTVGVNVPEPGSLTSTCSGSLVLYQVSYTGMNICDISNNVPCASVGSGNFTQTFCNLTKNPGRCPPA
jgi:hypothetical protein